MLDRPDSIADLDATFASLQQQIGNQVLMPTTDSMLVRGQRRKALRVAAMSLAVIAVVAIAGVVVTATASRWQLVQQPAASPSTTIPAGFLLYEAEAVARPAVVEHRSDVPTLWPPDLCIGQRHSTTLALAERSLMFADKTRAVSYERLDVFADVNIGTSAFAEIQNNACAVGAETVPIGDEALLIKQELPNKQFAWTLFVRQGAAVVEYYGRDRAAVERDGATMVAKLQTGQ